jgi:hypothetical protein
MKTEQGLDYKSKPGDPELMLLKTMMIKLLHLVIGREIGKQTRTIQIWQGRELGCRPWINRLSSNELLDWQDRAPPHWAAVNNKTEVEDKTKTELSL